MTTVRALLIPVDEHEPARVVSIEGTWEGLRATLESSAIQQVSLTADTLLWIDENGIYLKLAVNPRAGALIDSYYPGYTRERGPLRGPALVVGEDEDSEYADIPHEALFFFAKVTGETQAHPS